MFSRNDVFTILFVLRAYREGAVGVQGYLRSDLRAFRSQGVS